MQTIKTFVVVGLLLAVCYGAFVALNAPEVSIPEELELWANSAKDNALSDFEIPTLNIPEPFSPSIDSQQAKLLPSIPVSTLPEFPSVGPMDQSLPHITPPFPSQSPSPNEAHSPSQQSTAFDAAPPSGATLKSRPDSSGDLGLPPGVGLPDSSGDLIATNQSSNGNEPGPSIPFNPDQPLEESSIDDLISAVGSFSNTPLQDARGQKSQDSSASVPGEIANQELGKQDSLATGSASQSAADQASEGISTPTLPFPAARTRALELAQSGKLAEALEMMSQYYESVEIGYAEHTDLVDLLDALAREVIYSDRPLLGGRYKVSAQDSLASLSAKNRINPELLAAINKMGESQALLANSEIKLIEGPFRAQISLSRGELTLFLRKMYAGRFPVSISQQNAPAVGPYAIVDRRKDRTYYGTSVVIPADAPTNPYGGYWLSLGGNYSIHSSPQQVTSELEGAGCISLAPLDAADVYGILSKGCSVEVRP